MSVKYLAAEIKGLSSEEKFQVANIDETTLYTYNYGFFLALFNSETNEGDINYVVNSVMNADQNFDLTPLKYNGLVGIFYITQDTTKLYNATMYNGDAWNVRYDRIWLPLGAERPTATLDYENRTFTIQDTYELKEPWIEDTSNPSASVGSTFSFAYLTDIANTNGDQTDTDVKPKYVVISTSLLDELATTIQNNYRITNNIAISDMIDIIKGTYTPPEDMSGGN